MSMVTINKGHLQYIIKNIIYITKKYIIVARKKYEDNLEIVETLCSEFVKVILDCYTLTVFWNKC